MGWLRVAKEDLTPKQEAFVLVYLETGNATEAYRRAYNAENMAENVINVKASELLKNGKISLRINTLKERAASKVVLTRAWVLERLMRNAQIAMGETSLKLKIARNGKDNGKVVDELEIHDRDTAGANRALELLGKEVGMFVDRKEVGGPGDFKQVEETDLDHYIAAEVEALLGQAKPPAKSARH